MSWNYISSFNPFATRGNNFLDLLFVNNLDVIADVSLAEQAVRSDHAAFRCDLAFPGAKTDYNNKSKQQHSRYNWAKADLNLLSDELLKCPWGVLYSTVDVNKKCDIFYSYLDKAFDATVPTKKVNASKYPAWFNREVINSLNNKNRAHKLWKRTRLECHMVEFCVKRSEFKNLVRAAHKQYLRKINHYIGREPKLLWGYLRRKTKVRRVPVEVEHEGVVASTVAMCCQLFSRYFMSNFQPVTVCPLILPEAQQYGTESLSEFLILEREVEECLRTLADNKSAGPDRIPIRVLKHCRAVLSRPLANIFNSALRTGVFPERWKHAFVTPVIKKGSRYKVRNYRPISLLSVVSKVFEKLIHKTLYNHVSKHIVVEQHGFTSRRSTVTNLVEFTNDLANNINSKQQTDAVYTDFTKAFDSVNHTLLLHKISGYGVCGPLFKLLTSYLSGRTQVVVIDGGISNSEIVTSGVPQGSILGPLLFTLYVNDIPSCIKHSKCLMYADDLKIYRPVCTVRDCLLLQKDIDCLSEWCSVWKLDLNVAKCNVITFTNKKKHVILFHYILNGVTLERVQFIRDLGVVMTYDLSFNKYLDSITPKAYKLLGLLRRNCIKHFKMSTTRALYVALVRPQLEYASPVWSPHHVTKIESLEKVQKAYIKMMCYNHFKVEFHRKDYNMHCFNNRILTLENRRKLLDLTFLYKIANNLLDTSLLSLLNFFVPARLTRRHPTFYVPQNRVDILKYSPLRRLQSDFNFLLNNSDNCIDLFETSFRTFRSSVIVSLTNSL